MMYTRQSKEFLNELRLAKGRNCLIFAIAANSEEFVEQVSSSGLRVDEIHLNGNINLLEVLSDWEETSEDTVYFVEGVRNQFPGILGYLNLHRDIFYEIKRPIVIFGSEYEITEITKYAPDLWRFRSRTYDFTEKKEIRGGFPLIAPEPSVAVEAHLNYALPIFEEESEDEIRERIKVDNYLLEIIKEDYKRAELYMSLAISYLKLPDFERGEEYFEEALEVRKKLNDDIGMSIDYKRFGIFYAFKKEYNEAIKYYREAIKLNPDDAMAHYDLGVLLYSLKQFDETEDEWRDAIKLNPHFSAAHYNLGGLLYSLKRFDEAEEEYRKAIKSNPYDADAHYNFGVLLFGLKRFDEAEEEYRETIKISRGYAEAYTNLAILFLKTGRPEEAKNEFNIAKELFKHRGSGGDAEIVEVLLANT